MLTMRLWPINMLVANKEEIFQRVRDNAEVIQGFGVRRFGLFGSFVRGQQTAESDVDVLVEFCPGKKTFRTFMGLAFYLEDIFDRKVDLLTTESLSPYIGPKILAEVEYGIID